MNDIKIIIENAIKEDMPNGDVTTDNLIDDDSLISGEFIAKEDGVISGLEVAKLVFSYFDGVTIIPNKCDGDYVSNKEVIATIKGKTKSILKGERLALNIMQRMSGIASSTRKHVDLVKDYNCKILDTRKTTPNLRILEKLAVKHGGGTNHRLNLSDMVMIKDNHIKAAGSITNAVNIIKQKTNDIKVEVEVENLAMFKEAINLEVDIIMLDNMSNDLMKKAVELNNGKKLEASGNVSLDRLVGIAKTGVDYISVGNLTHSYKSLDISLKLK
ncbi:carboxylating nicotinate-nucleotide diphosphorylase [Mycoplasmatota bacterium]|nr:carboxylating nicotinate-nucleotide diphosphorylase [Mycoplasmatota bacterium]